MSLGHLLGILYLFMHYFLFIDYTAEAALSLIASIVIPIMLLYKQEVGSGKKASQDGEDDMLALPWHLEEEIRYEMKQRRRKERKLQTKDTTAAAQK
ncbi:hypothetical protein WR25_21180 [Diploscapter pachys]|uniref:Uncharacterized protein n=1 Tax=Diploscapter pachys TaxID=2018661 RepID=A0A2A2LCZ0_9BILA|nr:hypothetical protein WR25_21180 [Diploscapter pachys]